MMISSKVARADFEIALMAVRMALTLSAFLSRELIMKNITKFIGSAFMAVALIATVGCASGPKTSGTGEYIDDSVITMKVKAAIFNDPALNVAEINVETFKGVVQLSGFVISQEAATKAVSVARTVAGVTSVKNDMRLK
jgi:hypothetical protein